MNQFRFETKQYIQFHLCYLQIKPETRHQHAIRTKIAKILSMSNNHPVGKILIWESNLALMQPKHRMIST